MEIYTDEWYINEINIYPYISNSTKASYIYNLKTIKKICKDSDYHTILLNPNKFIKIMKGNVLMDNSLQSYITTILTCFKCTGLKVSKHEERTKWANVLNTVQKKINKKIDSSIPSIKQSLGFIKWEDIIKIRKQLDVSSPEYLLLSIYTLIPPRRILDYTCLKVYTNPKHVPELDHNHIHIFSNKYDSPYMFLNKYKTFSHYGNYFTKNIPERLVRTVERSIKNDPREYLFVKQDKTQFTDSHAFQKYVSRTLKKIFNNDNIHLNLIRHSFATHINNTGNLSYGYRKQIALDMGHSITKQQQYQFIV